MEAALSGEPASVRLMGFGAVTCHDERLHWFFNGHAWMLKLQNVESFVNGFLGYDLLAQRYVPYAYVYPYAEALGGLLMIGGILPILSIPIMLFIGGVGGVSVFKAVYLDKRELKCACVGGGSNVPLGFVSFSESAVMFGAACWMLVT